MLTRDLETMQLKIHVCPISVWLGNLEKMMEWFKLCLFLCLFACIKQASSWHPLVHCEFISAILLLSTNPSCRWMDKLSTMGFKGFCIKRYKTTLNFFVVRNMALFANFAEGSLRIIFNLDYLIKWAYTWENNITKSIRKV